MIIPLEPYQRTRLETCGSTGRCAETHAVIGQYDLLDHLFTETGMWDAHARLEDHYARMGQPDACTGQFYPGPHKFDLEMQSAAFDWRQ